MSNKAEATIGLKAAGLWVVIEYAIRAGLLISLGGALIVSGRLPRESVATAPVMGVAFLGTLALALVVLAMIFRRRVAREQLSLTDLGYEFDWRRTGVGFAAGIILLLVAWGTAHVDVALFPEMIRQFEAMQQLLAAAGRVVAIGLLLTNGVFGPLVEEFAWRGYIQYRLTRAWGVWMGLAATAVLFAVKHAIVDMSLGRMVTLLVGASLLGLIRKRWGTVACSAAHITLNFVATSYGLSTAIRG